LTTFDFTIIYHKREKKLVNGLSQRPDFKDNSELFTTKRQFLLNLLSKFQKYLGNTKNNPVEKQNIDSNKTPLFKNILNLIGAL